jgi:hypothetical protein
MAAMQDYESCIRFVALKVRYGSDFADQIVDYKPRLCITERPECPDDNCFNGSGKCIRSTGCYDGYVIKISVLQWSECRRGDNTDFCGPAGHPALAAQNDWQLTMVHEIIHLILAWKTGDADGGHRSPEWENESSWTDEFFAGKRGVQL